jgi:hypothetical protein
VPNTKSPVAKQSTSDMGRSSINRLFFRWRSPRPRRSPAVTLLRAASFRDLRTLQAPGRSVGLFWFSACSSWVSGSWRAEGLESCPTIFQGPNTGNHVLKPIDALSKVPRLCCMIGPLFPNGGHGA